MSENYYPYESSERQSGGVIHVLSVGYMMSLYVASFGLEVFEVIPFMYKNTQAFYLHIMFYIYCMLNVGSYYYAVASTDVSCKKSDTSPRHGSQKSGYFFCQSCQQNSPPRSHHCSICRACIDRRDHHCYFIANCIGRFNLRYFIVLNIWAGVVTVYCVVINLMYLHKHLVPLSPISIQGIVQLIPVVTVYQWFIGKVALFYLLVVTITWLTFVQILVSLVCGCFQIRLLFTGQTTYEFSHHVVSYDQGWGYNFRDLCGKYWYILWMLPMWAMKFGGQSAEVFDSQWSRDEDKPRKVI